MARQSTLGRALLLLGACALLKCEAETARIALAVWCECMLQAAIVPIWRTSGCV